jgi:hypothetical protein
MIEETLKPIPAMTRAINLLNEIKPRDCNTAEALRILVLARSQGREQIEALDYGDDRSHASKLLGADQ